MLPKSFGIETMRSKMSGRIPKIVKSPSPTGKNKSPDDRAKNEDDRKFPKARTAIYSGQKIKTSKARKGDQRGTPKRGGSFTDVPGHKKNGAAQSPTPLGHGSKTPPGNDTHPGKEDSDSQVTATDIQFSIATQTSTSLHQRSPELPRKCPQWPVTLAAHKHPKSCDCERPLVTCLHQPISSFTQTEPWQVRCQEESQTGPSLTAVGPFSRFDYKLRKVNLIKDDAFAQCCQRDPPQEHVPCSQQWFLYPSVNQQVSPLDIGVCQDLQTDGLTETGDEQVMCPSCLRLAYRKPYKDPELDDCECHPFLEDRRPHERSFQAFSAQVAREELVATKCTQTDLCLWLEVCKKPRPFTTGYWICGLSQIQAAGPGRLRAAGADFSQQVTATDIGDSKETQTCLQLLQAKPIRFTCSHLAAHHNRVLTGRAGTFRSDRCEMCSQGSQTRAAQDVSTQVREADSSVSKEQQTCGHIPNVTKCFVRRGDWASKTWH